MEIVKYTEDEDLYPIFGCGFLHQKSVGETAPIHTHNFHELFLVTEGHALHVINNDIQHIKRGDIVFIRPTDIHYFNFYQTMDFVFINIGISNHIFNKIIHLMEDVKGFNELLTQKFPPDIRLNEADAQKYEKYLHKIDLLMQENKADELMLFIRVLLVNLFSDIYLKPYQSELENTDLPHWFISVLIHMREQENFYEGLPRMIELSNCTQSHLNRICKKYLSVTPTQIINEIRLDYVANLLTNTNKNIIDVYLEAGFKNLSYFYDIFHKRYDCTPKEFQKAYYKKYKESNVKIVF